MKFLFILGPDSSHMQEVETVLSSHGVPYGYAAKDRTRLVSNTPANGVISPKGKRLKVGKRPVLVGCQLESTPADTSPITSQDSSDDPSKYWHRSLLGQVIKLLQQNMVAVGVEPRQLVAAATEVCLPAAVRGWCPKVNPQAVLDYRLGQIQASGSLTNTETKSILEYWEKVLQTAPGETSSDGVYILFLPEEYRANHLSLLLVQFIALRHEVAVVTRHTNEATLTGNLTDATISSFTEWASQNGLETQAECPPGFVVASKDE